MRPRGSSSSDGTVPLHPPRLVPLLNADGQAMPPHGGMPRLRLCGVAQPRGVPCTFWMPAAPAVAARPVAGRRLCVMGPDGTSHVFAHEAGYSDSVVGNAMADDIGVGYGSCGDSISGGRSSCGCGSGGNAAEQQCPSSLLPEHMRTENQGDGISIGSSRQIPLAAVSTNFSTSVEDATVVTIKVLSPDSFLLRKENSSLAALISQALTAWHQHRELIETEQVGSCLTKNDLYARFALKTLPLQCQLDVGWQSGTNQR